MAEFCPLCGKNLEMVGRAHYCQPLSGAPLVPVAKKPVANVANKGGKVANKSRYKDLDKRREYMRQYMAKKREQEKKVEDAPGGDAAADPAD